MMACKEVEANKVSLMGQGQVTHLMNKPKVVNQIEPASFIIFVAPGKQSAT